MKSCLKLLQAVLFCLVWLVVESWCELRAKRNRKGNQRAMRKTLHLAALRGGVTR